MRVKFIQDFQGRETNEMYFTAGQEWDFPVDMALRLIEDGRAESVLEEVEPLEAITVDKPYKKRRAHVN